MAPIRHTARRLTAPFVIAAAAVALAAPPAMANAIPGATYNGTVTGAGTMSFTVSADGAGITSFNANGPLVGNTCEFGSASATYSVPLPIVNNAFVDTTPPLTFSGSFVGLQGAQGTMKMKSTVFTGYGFVTCETPDLPWSATTTSLPPVTSTPPPAGTPSGDCVKAEEALTTARQAVKKARKRLKAAATVLAKQKAKQKLKKAEAKLKQAKEKQSAACG